MEILKINPVFKDYIWGGTRLKDEYHFKTDLDPVAEGWMLSCHNDGLCTVDGGKFDKMTLKEVIEKCGFESLVGKSALKFHTFPVLIKLIDAKDNLSVQVHPGNEYARRVEHDSGKTEMWYVLDANPGAELIYGFKEKISKAEFKSAIEDNTLPKVLNSVKVKKGDMFFIESGTVHAIGKGTFIAEIQQSSNATYRVYDYGRLGKDGKPRELHIKKALDVAKTEPPKYAPKPFGKLKKTEYGTSQMLASCDLFTVYHYELSGKLKLDTDENSFCHILIIDGSGKVEGRPFKKGDSFFVPASYGDFTLEGYADIITTGI